MTDVIDLTERRRIPRLFFVWLAVWPAVILIEAVILRQQSNVPWDHALVGKIVDYTPLALFSFAVWRLCGYLARRPLRPAATVAVHVAAAVVTVALWKGLFFFYVYLTIPPVYFARAVTESWMYQVVGALLGYGTMTGIFVAVHAARRETTLLIAARDAELAAIKAQLHPHFLLNSLNSVVALMTTDPARAREMIFALSELLHAAFERADVEEVPLHREMDLARRYLEIEQIRFADRLRVTIDCDDAARDVSVPPFLLQPLVENAVKHGIGKTAGEVSVRARRHGERVVIEVRDPGDGAEDVALQGGGRGLELTRRRLSSIYGDDYDLAFDRSAGGFIVRLDLPPAVTHA